MRLTRFQFLNLQRKAVTLMGMSGVGKSYLSEKLSGWGWAHYGCDDEIAATFLTEAVAKTTGDLAAFLGKPGDPAKGGLTRDEYRRRQQLYMNGEMESLRTAKRALQNTNRDFAVDSTGSICEIEDEALAG
ncbi:MAG: hypothetical protein LRY62_03145 [Alphaproteobacteria bacterium]|nr:hypothetical protein [Alphaproteobacteria bacterium]